MDTFGRDNPFMPSEASIRLLRLLWQLEVWLREMVYVELRARDANWQEQIKKAVHGWPPRPQGSDKRLTHMTTRHASAISYLTLGELLKVIQEPANWSLFESYFPPDNIFKARLEEISQIRHRIAHFRDPHQADVDRVVLFLRDLDKGVWRFATSYTGRKIHLDGVVDPIEEYFDNTHDLRHIVEMQKMAGGWRYADDRREPRLHFDFKCSFRPWFKFTVPSLIGQSGFIYHVVFSAPFNRCLPLDRILELTESVHPNCVHIQLDRRSIQVTVPSIIGKDLVVETIERFLDRCIESVNRGEWLDDGRVEQIASEWPEYVLGPSNPFGGFDGDSSCSMFALD